MRVIYTSLSTQRIALCDLLIGRHLRLQADEAFRGALRNADELALVGEQRDVGSAQARGAAALLGRFVAIMESRLTRAAHLEWIAVRAEQGQIHWGGRFNRCGFDPVQIDEHTASMTWGDMLINQALIR